MERYKVAVDKIRDPITNKMRWESTLYPDFPPKVSDYYIITKGVDRCDLVAHDYYGDVRLWWIINRVNNLPGGTLVIPPGTRIRIPYPLDIIDVEELLKEKQF